MPITQERMLAMMTALEDAMQGLHHAGELARDAANRVRNGGTLPAKEELEQLVLMLDPMLLLRTPLETSLMLERERMHWTKSRLRENERRRTRHKMSE